MRRLLPMWSESSAWWNSKAECPIRSSGWYPTNSVTLETCRKAEYCAHFILKGQHSSPSTRKGHPTGPRSEWSGSPCCGGWGRCRCQGETPHWRGEGWAHTAESWPAQQRGSSLPHQTDTCDLCSGGPATKKVEFVFNPTGCWQEKWFSLLQMHPFHSISILCSQFVFIKGLWGYWTFHSADLMLTVRPLLVRVLFIRRKKLISTGASFISFLFKPENPHIRSRITLYCHCTRRCKKGWDHKAHQRMER